MYTIQQSNDKSENKRMRHFMQMQCIRFFRILYSLDKNRTSMGVFLPHDVFGHFVDIGNYTRELAKYTEIRKMITSCTVAY